MTKNDRNDCVEDLLFPKRPNNQPGLSHIDYRIGTYSDFRKAIFRTLDSDPVLKDWTYRNSDDPGIALLEGASILGDILTFYQELYANEAYLRTAQWRQSISDLVALLGYRLSPGVGGKGTFAFEVKGNKSVRVPAGFPIKAQLEGLEAQSEFETVTEFTAYPWLSAFHLYRELEIPDIDKNTKTFQIKDHTGIGSANISVELEEEDRLLIGDLESPSNPTHLLNPQIVIIDSIRELHGCKLYTIGGALQREGSHAEMTGFKLGRSFRHFGHNAPPTSITVANGVVNETPSAFSRPVTGAIYPTLQETEFPLDQEVEDLSSGSEFLIEVNEKISICRITKVQSNTITWGAVTGATSMVTVDQPLENNSFDIREIQLHEVLSPSLTLSAGMKESNSPSSGNTLLFLGSESEAETLQQRSLFFVPAETDPFTAGVTLVQPSSQLTTIPPIHELTLDREVEYTDFSNENPTTTVYGNLIEATQGKTEKDAFLGNGDHREIFQTFPLPKSPLTYHNVSGATPPETPELQIYVENRLWQRVSSFFGHAAEEEIYIVRDDADGKSWVQFGDGKTGARLPSGVKNIRAQYRTGIEAYGALQEETTVQAGGKLDHLEKIQLPGVVSGGESPENEENTREAAPGKVQSLGRLVSLKDFESETLAIPGVSKALVAWDLVDNVPCVVVTVLMERGRDAEIEAVRGILEKYNQCRGPQRFPVIVQPGKFRYLYVDATVALDPNFLQESVEKALREAIGVVGMEGDDIEGTSGLFQLGQRRFGQNEYATKIEGTLQNVEGVIWTKVKAFGSLGEAEDPSTLSLPDEPKPLNSVVSCDRTQVLCLYKPHLQLSIAKSETIESC